MKVKSLQRFHATIKDETIFRVVDDEFEIDDTIAKQWIKAGLVAQIKPAVEKTAVKEESMEEEKPRKSTKSKKVEVEEETESVEEESVDEDAISKE